MRVHLPAGTVILAAALVGCPRGPGDTGDTGDTADTDTDTGTDSDSDSDSDTDTSAPDRPTRVATWNVGGVGNNRDCTDDPATAWDEYAAAVAVLRRIDADVVCLNEVCDSSDATAFAELAQDLGYTTYYSPPNSINPNSAQRNGLMTRLTVVAGPEALTSAELSGDSNADDLTRLPLRITVDLPGRTEDLTVVCQHWKSGFDDVDEFRRLIDSHRTAQAVTQSTGDWVLAMGDVNSEVTDSVEFPSPFTALPSSGLPSGYYLGNDLYTDLTDGTGLVNDPFVPFDAIGWVVALARQQDGTNLATRPTSGRRIDYIFLDPALPTGWAAEVFDCVDDAAGTEGLPKAGDPVLGNACGQASDHLPVILDLP